MENASKALVMVGSVLIGIMLISFLVLMLRRGGQLNANYDTQMSDNELAKFNSQFEVYAKSDNTFFDVITAANLAYDVNKRCNWDAQAGVSITIIQNGNTNNVLYSLPAGPSGARLGKNCFFDKTNHVKDIYNPLDGENDKSIVQINTSRKDTDDSTYLYKFNCTASNSITYNSTTGKVQNMTFSRENN